MRLLSTITCYQLLFALLLTVVVSELFATHFLLFHNEQTNKNTSLAKLLSNRADRNDYFYAILGAPNNDRATKMHLDSFTMLDRLFQGLSIAAKGSLLNTDVPQHWQQPQQPMQSYFGGGEWLHDYAQQQLGVEWQSPHESVAGNFDYFGMMAHSWKDCMASWRTQTVTCIHVLQIRNTGSFFPDDLSIEQLSPLFEWMKARLNDHKDTPIVIVFQAFEVGYDQLLNEFIHGQMIVQPPHNLLAVIFSLMTNPVNFETKFCFAWGLQVPIIAMGAQSTDRYFLIQFNPYKRGFKHLYEVAANSSITLARDVNLSARKCL